MRRAVVLTVALLGCGKGSPAPAGEPAPVARDAAATAPAVLFAAGRDVLALAASGDALYAVLLDGDASGERADSIWRVDLATGSARKLGVAAIVTAVALDGEDLVIASVRRPVADDDDEADLIRMSTRDGAMQTLAHVRADELAIGAAHVFVRNQERIARVARDGGAVESVGGAMLGHSLVAVGDDVFFVDLDVSGGTVWRARPDRPAADVVAVGPGCCSNLAVADGVVYAQVLDGIAQLRDDGVHVIADMPARPVAANAASFAITARSIWWLTDDGELWSVGRDGGVPLRRRAASGQSSVVGPALTANADAVFVADGTDVSRIDDGTAPPPAEAVEWLTIAHLDRDDGRPMFDRIDRQLGPFADPIRRGDLGVRIVGGGEPVDAAARAIIAAVGAKARITVDATAAAAPRIDVSARDVERLFSPR